MRCHAHDLFPDHVCTDLCTNNACCGLVPVCDCGAPASGDFPGFGLKCEPCRLAARHATSTFKPVTA